MTLASLQLDAQQHAGQVPRTRDEHRGARAVGHAELDVQAGGEAGVQGADDGCDGGPHLWGERAGWVPDKAWQ